MIASKECSGDLKYKINTPTVNSVLEANFEERMYFFSLIFICQLLLMVTLEIEILQKAIIITWIL